MIVGWKRLQRGLWRKAAMQRMCVGVIVKNFLGFCNRALVCVLVTIVVRPRTMLPQAGAWVPTFVSVPRHHRSAFGTRLHLYNACGGQKSLPLLMKNGTRLHYKDDQSFGSRNASVQSDSSPGSIANKLASFSNGTFGDIMSPTVDDANLLFRDGLVTSETYSLEGTYGITNPLDRMAVTANGNLQRLFSSYYDAPVVVEVEHCIRYPNSASWTRRVLLKIFDQTFCTADSIVEVHSEEVEQMVESGKVGIGQLFRHFNILPNFSLLCAGPTSNGGIWRNYTLESELVTCSIHEVFCSGLWELSP